MSITFAFLIFLSCIVFTVLTLAYTAKYYKASLANKNNYCGEFFSGTKKTKSAKWYSFMLVARRNLLVIFLMFGIPLSIGPKIGYFITVQVVYTGLLVYARPLEQPKDNAILIQNEILLLGLA